GSGDRHVLLVDTLLHDVADDHDEYQVERGELRQRAFAGASNHQPEEPEDDRCPNRYVHCALLMARLSCGTPATTLPRPAPPPRPRSSARSARWAGAGRRSSLSAGTHRLAPRTSTRSSGRPGTWIPVSGRDRSRRTCR